MPGLGNTSPKDMESLLPLMSMVIYSIDKAKKFRLNREVSRVYFFCLLNIIWNCNHYHRILNLKIESLMFLLWLPELLHPAHRESVLTPFAFLSSVKRVNKKLIRTGLVWKRTSLNWLTCKDRRLPSPVEKRKNGQRRSESWTKRILKNSVGWRWGFSECYKVLAYFCYDISRAACRYASNGQLWLLICW